MFVPFVAATTPASTTATSRISPTYSTVPCPDSRKRRLDSAAWTRPIARYPMFRPPEVVSLTWAECRGAGVTRPDADRNETAPRLRHDAQCLSTANDALGAGAPGYTRRRRAPRAEGLVGAPGHMTGPDQRSTALAVRAKPPRRAIRLGLFERVRLRRRVRFLRKQRELQMRDLGGLIFDMYRFGSKRQDPVREKLRAMSEADRALREFEAPPGGRRGSPGVREPGRARSCPRCL